MNFDRFREYYNLLSKFPGTYLYIGEDGEFTLDEPPAHIISGSFNPVHEGHWAMWRSAIKQSGRVGQPGAAFEISLRRRDKPVLPADELFKRANQFLGQALLITNASTFIDKDKALSSSHGFRPLFTTFHVGIDTALRVLDDHGMCGCAAMEIEFRVYDRSIGGSVRTLDNCGRQFPGNFQRIKLQDASHLEISSSKIRGETDGSAGSPK